MSDDLPGDVRETLSQLFAAAESSARTRDVEAVREILETVETVVENKIPSDDLKTRLRHGVERVRETCESEPLVAAEYLAAMRRLVDAN